MHGSLEEQTFVNTSSGSIDIQSWTERYYQEYQRYFQNKGTFGRVDIQSVSLVIAIFAEGACMRINTGHQLGPILVL